jgi:hypothetical protein
MKRVFFVLSFLLLFHARFASALTFNITYDASVTASTNSAQIQSAFGAVAQTFQDVYTNVATINITVYWGATGPFSGGISLGRSQFGLIGSTYSQITNALRSRRASADDTNSVASLPAIDPTGGVSWLVPLAEARVLGLYPTNDSQEDGAVGFASDKNYTFDPNNRSVSGKFDFMGVAEHELTEVLGRCMFDLTTHFVPYDLFRFTNSGVRSVSLDSTTNAYFSVDNGATALKFFYTNFNAGDVQDWKSSGTPDSFDAFSSSGHVLPMSTVDFVALDVLGYNGARLASPRVYGSPTNGNFQLRFVNSPGVSFTVLTTTNLAQPVASWFVLGTATESPAGQFQFTDTTKTNQQRFYLIRTP